MDDETLARLASDDRQAYLLLYDRYVERMFSYFAWRFGSADAADLTSEVFLRALGALGRFDGGRSWAGWLYGIARNVAAERLRRREPELPGGEEPLTDSPEAAALQSEREESIRAAVAQLPPAQREVIELRYWAGLSYRDIATITGRSEGAVRVQSFRTLERLKTLFEEDSSYVDFTEEFQDSDQRARRSAESPG
jgi:RNA polymerase sigma-70 factor (ECF subfamily)